MEVFLGESVFATKAYVLETVSYARKSMCCPRPVTDASNILEMASPVTSAVSKALDMTASSSPVWILPGAENDNAEMFIDIASL